MRNIFFLLLLVLSVQPGLSLAAFDGSTAYERGVPSLVHIRAPLNDATRSGSGIIVAKDAVLTNCHVVQSASNVTVTFDDGETQSGAFGGRYGGLDLCLLEVRTGNRKAARVGRIDLINPGQVVFALGNPLGLKASISAGVVASIREQDSYKLIQFTAPISPGSSGGGLFDADGKLIGITTSTYTSGQNVNFAIPIDYWRVLTPSKRSEDQVATVPDVSFKGVPFGASKDELLKSLPGSECRSLSASTVSCSGATEFLGQQSQFFAIIGPRGLFLVIVRIFSGEPSSAFSDAALAISERFKLPKGLRPGQFINWEIGYRGEQGILLAKCDGERGAKCQIDADTPGIEIVISDGRRAEKKGNGF